MPRLLVWLFWFTVFVGPPIFAGQTVYTHWRSPQPVAMRCAEYLATRPREIWLDLSDCTIDYTQSIRIYKEKTGETSDDVNYAPLVGEIGETPVKLFLKLPDEESMMLNGIPDHPTQQQQDYLVAKLRPLAFHRHIKGLILVGLDSDDNIRDGIRSAGVPVVADWAIIEQKEPTSLWLGLAALLIPAAGAGWLLWRRPRDTAEAADIAAAPPHNLRVPEPPPPAA